MRPWTRCVTALALAVSGASLAGSPELALSNAASAVNTFGYEDSPFLSPDGQGLYFMYTPWTVWPTFFGNPAQLVGPARPSHHVNPDGNPWEDSDVYVAWRQPDGSWGTPSNLGFNDGQADCCAMTWNHEEFFYQRTQFPNAAQTDLFAATRLPDGSWDRRSLGSVVNRPDAAEQNPHVTSDGSELFFTSDRAGGQGGTDLYLALRGGDGAWQPAAALPPSINTAADEDQAWLTPDGQTLYFNREPGPRIMVSQRTPQGWSPPVAVSFGGEYPDAAEVSGTADGQRLVFAVVRPELDDIVLVISRRGANGAWSKPVQFDGAGPPRSPARLRLVP